MDVSLASTAICVVSGHGKVIKETTAPSEPEELERALRSLSGTVVGVGLEAGPLSQWLHRQPIEAGFETVLMETRQVKCALKAMPIKTDRRDAEGIARLLHMGWFRPVHAKSKPARHDRQHQDVDIRCADLPVGAVERQAFPPLQTQHPDHEQSNAIAVQANELEEALQAAIARGMRRLRRQ